MEFETIYRRSWVRTRPQSRWFEYLRIDGGAARIMIRIETSGCSAVLSLWTLERGYQPFLSLPEPAIREQSIEAVRDQLIEVAEGMLRLT